MLIPFFDFKPELLISLLLSVVSIVIIIIKSHY